MLSSYEHIIDGIKNNVDWQVTFFTDVHAVDRLFDLLFECSMEDGYKTIGVSYDNKEYTELIKLVEEDYHDKEAFRNAIYTHLFKGDKYRLDVDLPSFSKAVNRNKVRISLITEEDKDKIWILVVSFM